MSTLLTVKASDTNDWTIAVSDSSGTVVSLASARVKFRLRRSEQITTNYFVRDTAGTGSDYIAISAPASDGIITITPTISDYAELSDMYGILVGECWVQEADNDIFISPDIEINIQESLY